MLTIRSKEVVHAPISRQRKLKTITKQNSVAVLFYSWVYLCARVSSSSTSFNLTWHLKIHFSLLLNLVDWGNNCAIIFLFNRYMKYSILVSIICKIWKESLPQYENAEYYRRNTLRINPRAVIYIVFQLGNISANLKTLKMCK